tara:strand:- start:3830 stop:4312 length:483 start_codon:yes stop_codon:yes gene_type:complete
MARKIGYGGTAGETLTVKLIERININGKDYGSSQSFTVRSISNVSRRIVSVSHATNGTQIYEGGSVPGQGKHVSTNVKYIRITNLDENRAVLLNLEGNSHYAQFKLHAGQSFILGDPKEFDNNADIDNFSAETITKIEAKADGSNYIDLEVFVADTAGAS